MKSEYIAAIEIAVLARISEFQRYADKRESCQDEEGKAFCIRSADELKNALKEFRAFVGVGG